MAVVGCNRLMTEHSAAAFFTQTILAGSLAFGCSSSRVNTVAGTGGSAGSTGGSAGSGGTGGNAGTAGTGGSAAASGNGCADALPKQTYGGDMVGCNGNTNQCNAETLCASGWHLCTLAEYVARGGKDVPATGRWWLKACVRTNDADVLFCPKDEWCNNCSSSGAPAPLVASQDCSGKPQPEVAAINTGLRTDQLKAVAASPTCPISECSYIAPDDASAGLGEGYGAICCK